MSATFNFVEKSVRVEMDENNNPLFLAKDICEILELNNVSQALSRLDDDEKGIILNDTHGGKQEMSVVNESGLYSLVLSSRKPEAKKFRKWVTSELLPSIQAPFQP
jgi:prophage antirepressor-like protein